MEKLKYTKFKTLLISSFICISIIPVVAFGFIYLFIRFKLRGDGITKEELICSPRARSGRSTIKLLISIAVPIAIAPWS